MEKTCPFMGAAACQKQCALKVADGCAFLSIGKQLYDIKRELDVIRTEANKNNRDIFSALANIAVAINRK